ncbi:C-C motif chemokine 14-like [Paramormyrops kingsleyae]|uniref:C-C motif chemokine 14-like n=1 Tax=Paramormyrops kingsleyae TaxID=1676925 RepID=UPI003B975576
MKPHQISAFFLLMTVLLSSTLAQNANGPENCCFTYFTGRLRKDLIDRYAETRGDCSKPGIILYTKKGKEVCVDPSDQWVQGVKKRLDQGFFQ